LYKKGLIYEDLRINNWDPKLQTTIADSEIEYKEIKSSFNYVKWKVKETNEEIIIGTTRPELIPSCGMVIFNPEDERYKHLEGKTAVSPIYEKEIPIKSHTLAQIDKGTGIVMMCSAGDLSDIVFFREMRLKPIISINLNGTMNENAGFLNGIKIKEARIKIIEELKNKNLLERQEEITHRTPISERSKAEIEFIQMPEFYLKQLEFKDEIKKLSKEIKFYPQTSRKILNDWIDSISIDWPISRRRFYATEIPLWYSNDKDKLIAVPQKGNYYQPWKQEPPKDADVLKDKKIIGKVKDFDKKWIGEEKVFDTWFDSSISELYITKTKIYPVTLRPQGKEIVRTWLYYTLLRGYLEKQKMPFEEVWIHNHILDEKAKKMSKSLGNVIDPQEIIREFGAESFRFWAAHDGDISKQDISCSKQRIRAELKTLNKLLNVSKFVMMFDKPKKPDLTSFDKLFINYIEELTWKSEKFYDEYDFYNPTIRLRYFLWEVFASHYVELVKSRVYNNEGKFSKQESDSAKYTLHFLLERFLTLVYPVIPQITSFIANEKGIDLLKEQWPKIDKDVDEKHIGLIEEIMGFNSDVWKQKKEKGISLRNEISGIKIPNSLREFEKDLKICHGLI
jgi:valyl-tRNA synthetase